jgi:hypothetical protein
MSVRAVLAVVCILVLSCLSAAAEVKKLDGTSLTGDVTAVSPKELQLRSADKTQTIPLQEVMAIDWNVTSRPSPRVPYLRVKLTDGTLMYCLAFNLKGKTVELILLGGQTVHTSLDHLHHVVCDAHDTASLAAFDAILAEPPTQDAIRLQSKEDATINAFEGVIQGANEAGNQLLFRAKELDKVSSINIARLRGMYFSRTNTGPGPTAIARVHDSFGDVFVATAFAMMPAGCEVTTQAGFKITLPQVTVQKFDLTLGKLAYLSDMEPARVEESPILADLYHFRRDKNLEGGPLSIGRKVYSKGLALHSKTVLEYDVAGYSTFRCVLGLDDAMSGSGHAVVKIEGDGKELLATGVSSRDNKPQDVSLSIKGVQKLRIIVDYGEDLDLGDHVDLADARIIK